MVAALCTSPVTYSPTDVISLAQPGVQKDQRDVKDTKRSQDAGCVLGAIKNKLGLNSPKSRGRLRLDVKQLVFYSVSSWRFNLGS